MSEQAFAPPSEGGDARRGRKSDSAESDAATSAVHDDSDIDLREEAQQ
jgi:hypothetical protein